MKRRITNLTDLQKSVKSYTLKPGQTVKYAVYSDPIRDYVFGGEIETIIGEVYLNSVDLDQNERLTIWKPDVEIDITQTKILKIDSRGKFKDNAYLKNLRFVTSLRNIFKKTYVRNNEINKFDLNDANYTDHELGQMVTSKYININTDLFGYYHSKYTQVAIRKSIHKEDLKTDLDDFKYILELYNNQCKRTEIDNDSVSNPMFVRDSKMEHFNFIFTMQLAIKNAILNYANAVNSTSTNELNEIITSHIAQHDNFKDELNTRGKTLSNNKPDSEIETKVVNLVKTIIELHNKFNIEIKKILNKEGGNKRKLRNRKQTIRICSIKKIKKSRRRISSSTFLLKS